MQSGREAASVVSSALLIMLVSVCLRAADNMVSSTVPLLGSYVFALGTLYGGVFSVVYSGSSLVCNWFVNPRMSGTIRRKAFIASGGAFAAAIFILSVTNAATTLIVGVVAGLATGILYSNVAAAATVYAEEYRSERLLAMYPIGLGISLIVGPAIESYLLSISYAAVFLVFGFISAALFVLSFRLRLSNVARMPTKMSPLAKRGVLDGILTGAISYIPYGAISVFLPIYAVDSFGVSTTVAYSSFIPLYVVSLTMRILMLVRPQRRIRPLIALSMITTLACLVAMFIAPTFALFVVVVAVFGIPQGLTFTLSMVLMSRTSGSEERNTTASRLNASYSVVGIAVPFVVSYIAEVVGIRLAFAMLVMPVALVCLLLFRSLWGEKRPSYIDDYSWQTKADSGVPPG